MQKKLIFVAGAALGYVIGTRKGRQGYEKLKHQASDFWLSPRVQRTVSDVEDFVGDKLPAASGTVSGARKAVDEAAISVAGEESVPSTGESGAHVAAENQGSPDTPSGSSHV